MTAHSHYPEHYLLDEFMPPRGELEYEIVFLCVSDATAALLEQCIQALAPVRVVTQVFNLLPGAPPVFPDFLVPQTRELFFTARITRNELVRPRALRISTTSKVCLHTIMETLNYPYYLFGVRITRNLYEEVATEQTPFVPIIFHGPEVRLEISGGDEGTKWIKVMRTIQFRTLITLWMQMRC